jgi:hypothetical protein
MPRSKPTDEWLNITETLLKAQLAAIEELRSKREKAAVAARGRLRGPQHTSQTDVAYDILTKAAGPLHIVEIIDRAKAQYGLQLSRDSLVSAILKKAARGQQFVKTGKNTYGLLGRDERP